MENQPSRDELRAELRRRGLPRAYIERLLAELDDHFSDLLEERNSTMSAARKLQIEPDDMQQRLGEPTQLAIFAAEQYHSRSFWGRYPWFTYLVMPLPLWVACWIACWLALSAIVLGIVYITPESWRASIQPHEYPWTQAILLALVCWYVMVVPPIATAWSLCRIAQRNSLDWRWPAFGCALLAIVAATFSVSYRLSSAPGDGRFMIGFDVAASFPWFALTFLPKFALALGIGLLLIRRAQQKSTSDNAAGSSLAIG